LKPKNGEEISKNEEIGLKIVDLHSEVCSLISDMKNEGDIEVSVGLPSYLTTAKVMVSSPGMQQAGALLLQMMIPIINKEFRFEDMLDEKRRKERGDVSEKAKANSVRTSSPDSAKFAVSHNTGSSISFKG
jgi:hypothetical protein